jgi:succinate-acetate transporter protein
MDRSVARSAERDGVSTDGPEFDFWRERAHISLQPVAAPSVLGLYGFAAATFIVATNLAGWYGNKGTTPEFLFPFAAMAGGLAQFLASMWAFRARDTLATAMHGIWGTFWLAYGLLYLLVAGGTLTAPTPFVALGFWFIALAAITWAGAFAALAENRGLALVLIALAAGSTCVAVGMTTGASIWTTVGAWFFIASALIAWYVATALLLESTYHRRILPVGKVAGPAMVGRRAPVPHPIQYPAGEPGVKVGQ